MTTSDRPRPRTRTKPAPCSVLIVDDQPVVRQGFELFLRTDSRIRVVGHADSGATAIERVRALQPDVVLLDIRMPHRDGLWATREIVAMPHAPKVVIITTFDLDEYLFAALDLGAVGFLLKDTDPTELVESVLSAARGDIALSPRVVSRVVAEFARRRPGARVRTRGSDFGLSAREIDVVELLVEGSSNDEIAAALRLEPSTVKTHVANICRKVGVRTRIQVVVWAYRNGLVGP